MHLRDNKQGLEYVSFMVTARAAAASALRLAQSQSSTLAISKFFHRNIYSNYTILQNIVYWHVRDIEHSMKWYFMF